MSFSGNSNFSRVLRAGLRSKRPVYTRSAIFSSSSDSQLLSELRYSHWLTNDASASGFTRKKLTSTCGTLSAITGSPSMTLPGKSEPRLAKPTLGAISRVVSVFSTLVPKVALLSASSAGSTVTIRSRFGSRCRRRSSFRFGASSQAPSTLPLFLSTRWTLLLKSCSGSSGMEKVSTSVAAPSNWTSEASSKESVLP